MDLAKKSLSQLHELSKKSVLVYLKFVGIYNAKILFKYPDIVDSLINIIENNSDIDSAKNDLIILAKEPIAIITRAALEKLKNEIDRSRFEKLEHKLNNISDSLDFNDSISLCDELLALLGETTGQPYPNVRDFYGSDCLR